ncbi:MAG: hypothetical protein MUD12_06390 [Spirochaetes bacterium]|jgi:hypothetical protein|nr:hypothetical protein [Spirochaetota bacterium]
MKNIPFPTLILSVYLLCSGIDAFPASQAEHSTFLEWGTTIDIMKKSNDARYTLFTPIEKPEYKNRIIKHLSRMDEGLLKKIIIMRIKSEKQVDYLFLDGKLFSVLEDWGKVDGQKLADLKKSLAGKYGEPTVRSGDRFTVYSFNNASSRIFCYATPYKGGKTRCRIYYYTKKLYKMLLLDNQ